MSVFSSLSLKIKLRMLTMDTMKQILLPHVLKQVWLWPKKAPCMYGQEPRSYWCIYEIPKIIAASEDKSLFFAGGIQLYTLA